MTDIVERLHEHSDGWELLETAAAEIERLRKDCTALVDHSIKLEREVERLRAALDEQVAQ